MLSKVLYYLCSLLSTPYDNLNLNTQNTHNLNHKILEDIYFKKLFNFEWEKKLNSLFKNYQFNYNYNVLDQNSKFIKIKLNLNISFTVQNYDENINSASINEYLIILEHLHNKFKIQFIIENEENPFLYYYILNSNLEDLTTYIFSENHNIYENNLSSIDSLYETFMTSNSFSSDNYTKRNALKFNIEEACNYAEKFALNYNPEYKSFAGIGGDCTNFMSQILHAGGFEQNETWKPYANAWIRVEEFYLYLTSRKLGINLPNDTSLDRGCLIQFYTPAIGRYFHNGFITYKLKNNDYLYCCHSYNKLNFPLSQIYPNRYPKLRALRFN